MKLLSCKLVLLMGSLLAIPISAAEKPFTFGGRLRIADLEEGQLDGRSGTLALRANWMQNWLENQSWVDHFSTKIQVDHVAAIWKDQYFDGVHFNGKPRIPDVEGTDINQAFLAYDYQNIDLRIGRQLLEWDDQRFISSNGFWQNPQTFDAALVTYHLATESSLQYAYLNNANRIFGDKADTFLSLSDINYVAQKGLRPKDGLGDHAMHSHLIQAQWREWDYSEISLFGYFINDEDFSVFSSHTLGFHYSFQQKFSTLNYRLNFSAARQNRTSFNHAYDLPYIHLENALLFGRIEWALDYERLGSAGGKAFLTPFGFTHEYQGWADRFTATPSAGVDDFSLKNSSRFSWGRIDVRYHEFFEVQGGSRYGDELDAEVSHAFATNHKVALRFAMFKPDVAFQAQLKKINNAYMTWTYNY